MVQGSAPRWRVGQAFQGQPPPWAASALPSPAPAEAAPGPSAAHTCLLRGRQPPEPRPAPTCSSAPRETVKVPLEAARSRGRRDPTPLHDPRKDAVWLAGWHHFKGEKPEAQTERSSAPGRPHGRLGPGLATT